MSRASITGWQEIHVEDRRATSAEIATNRLDFAAWLEPLSLKRRSVLERLEVGPSTGDTEQTMGVSPGHISPLRWKLMMLGSVYQ